jgi:hypothetical protein
MKSIKQNKQNKKQNKKQIIVIRPAQKQQLANLKNWTSGSQVALTKSLIRQRRKQNNAGGFGGYSKPQQMPFSAPTSGGRGMRKVQTKTVSFREELGSINGSAAFATTAYNINPGQAGSFPWLSLEAAQWEKYRFKKLQYEYTPQVTEFSTNGVGSVVIGFDSDASDPPPNNLTHALNCMPREYDLPCKHICLNIPVGYMNTLTDGFFVRTGNLPGQSDIKTYDCGVMNLSTVGNVNANAIGILAVEYTVEFLIPILEPTVGAPANNSVTFLVDSKAAQTTATVYQPLLAAAASTSLSVTNGVNVVNTAGSVVPPPGNYMLITSCIFYSSAGVISTCYMNVLKNAIIQVPGTSGNTSEYINTAALNGDVTLNSSTFISCNGTDAITLSLYVVFASGTCGATTTLSLIAI